MVAQLLRVPGEIGRRGNGGDVGGGAGAGGPVDPPPPRSICTKSLVFIAHIPDIRDIVTLHSSTSLRQHLDVAMTRNEIRE